MAVSGPRVLDGGGRVIVPWSERVRYGAKRAGYHGGITLTEVVVPVVVLNRTGAQAPPGWTDAPPATPDWWHAAQPAAPAPPVTVVVGEQTSLFPTTGETAPAAEPRTWGWIEALFDSAVFVLQETAAARVAPPRARIEAALGALADRGGTMTRAALAKAIGTPEARIPGLLLACSGSSTSTDTRSSSPSPRATP